MIKQNVLFLCTGNSARSQIGEALLRHYGGDQFDVYSAGLQPKGINPYTVRVLNEIGLDISSQWSKGVQEYMGRMFFAYVITVCGDADKSCPQALWAHGGQKLHWPFDDPAAVTGSDEEKLAAFRATRDLMSARIQTWLQELAAQKANA
ncbi:MAG: arsenate reductase ArsC [Chloroflexi bacterium]|nr:arsenate reductase ArsC [Chloroflexota bacterium]